MKQIFVGCLIVLMIALVGFGVAGYYVYRAARPMIDDAADYVSRARELATLSDQDKAKTPNEPPANAELTTLLNPASLEVVKRCKVEPLLGSPAAGARYQFERLGYFAADPDSRQGTPVFNRTVSLKDSFKPS